MENKKNNGLIVGIIAMVVAVIGTGIAFAALSTTLNVNGTAEVDPASWDIHFKTLSSAVTTGSASVTTAPTLTGTTKIETFDVKLTKPGDSVTYTFYVENTGTLAAKIGTFNAPVGPTCTGQGTNATTDASTVCGNLTYTIKYVSDNSNVGAGDELLVGESKQIELKIMYNDVNELPDEKVEITDLSFSMIYIEK